MKKSILKSTAVAAMISLSFGLAGCGSDKTAEKPPAKAVEQAAPVEKHIYDDAKVVDMMNGTGTNVIGKVSITKVRSSDITQEALEDWYFNYVKKNLGHGDKWNYALIVYSDNENLGVLCNGGSLTKDVTLTKDKHGETYSASPTQSSVEYVEDSARPGHLKAFVPEKKVDTEAIKQKVVSALGGKATVVTVDYDNKGVVSISFDMEVPSKDVGEARMYIVDAIRSVISANNDVELSDVIANAVFRKAPVCMVICDLSDGNEEFSSIVAGKREPFTP